MKLSKVDDCTSVGWTFKELACGDVFTHKHNKSRLCVKTDCYGSSKNQGNHIWTDQDRCDFSVPANLDPITVVNRVVICKIEYADRD